MSKYTPFGFVPVRIVGTALVNSWQLSDGTAWWLTYSPPGTTTTYTCSCRLRTRAHAARTCRARARTGRSAGTPPGRRRTARGTGTPWTTARPWFPGTGSLWAWFAHKSRPRPVRRAALILRPGWAVGSASPSRRQLLFRP